MWPGRTPGAKPRPTGCVSGAKWSASDCAWIPGISQRDAVRVFEKLDYRVARQSGHVVMTNGKQRLTIPRRNPVNAIAMGSIAKSAGLTPEEFRKLL